MKFRNGFVSNSSSASFVIAFPKDDPIALKDIEEWLGGYNTDIDPEIMDTIGFQFWKTQYFDEDMYRRDFKGTGEEYDYHHCGAGWKERADVWCCPHNFFTDDDGLPTNPNCQKCKYHLIEKRIDRGDDYYEVLDDCYGERLEDWLVKHKNDKIVYFEVDDNNPARGIDYNTAYEITSNAFSLFNNKTDNVLCVGGK